MSEGPVVQTSDEVPERGEGAQEPPNELLTGLAGALNVSLPQASEEVNEEVLSQNYADRTKFLSYVDYVKANIVPLMQQTRLDRRSLQDRWMEIDNTDTMTHDANKKYNGRSQAYLPIANRNYDTLVSNITKGLIPSDEYIGVVDRADKSSTKAQDVKTYLQWQFESVAKLRKKLKPFLREYVKYGNAVLKYRWYKGDDYCPAGLQVSARSIFNWYIYPTTADSIEEAVMVFEDMDVPHLKLLEMERNKAWLYVEEAKQSTLAANADQNNRAERLAGAELPNNTVFPTDHAFIHRISEVWTFMQIDEVSKDKPTPVKVVLANDSVVMEIRVNQMPDKKPPYLAARTEVKPGIFYSQGFGKKVQAFQYLVNDFANQTNDNGNYALNPIAKMIPNKLVGPPKALSPGVVMYMTEQDAVEFDRPPADQMQWGMMLIDKYTTMGASYGGAPPQLQGTAGGKTATSSQILQRNAITPIQDIVEDLENDVLVPLMRITWLMATEFSDGNIVATVAGERVEISPSDIQLDAEFRWLASSQSASQQQRAQQGIQLLSAMSPPLIQLTQANGYNVNPVPLLKRIFTDAMGYRGFDEFIAKLQPGQAPAGAMPPPGAPGPGAPGAPPGPDLGAERIRSAVEQSAAPTGDMVPGEGEDFMDVRENADELSSFGGSLE